MPIDPAKLALALDHLLERRAHAVGATLIERLSHPGKGTLHMGNVNPSSLPGDYPAAQTEALLQSIDVRKVKPLTYAVGSFADMNADGFDHAVELESRPPSQGGRAFLEKALHDPEIQQAFRTGVTQ